MKTFFVKTKALMEQSYIIEAETLEDAKIKALENSVEINEQTLVGDSEVLSIEEL